MPKNSKTRTNGRPLASTPFVGFFEGTQLRFELVCPFSVFETFEYRERPTSTETVDGLFVRHSSESLCTHGRRAVADIAASIHHRVHSTQSPHPITRGWNRPANTTHPVPAGRFHPIGQRHRRHREVVSITTIDIQFYDRRRGDTTSPVSRTPVNDRLTAFGRSAKRHGDRLWQVTWSGRADRKRPHGRHGSPSSSNRRYVFAYISSFPLVVPLYTIIKYAFTAP